MAASDMTFDVSAELSALKHEMKNQKMKALPTGMTVQRRPLRHAPVASPFAGVDVQKVVYVSSHTPLMSAVKRVRKLLSQVEKRAVQSAGSKIRNPAEAVAGLVEVSNRLAKSNEEVLVKASGKAMQQALRVGEWFRSKEKEMICNVDVRTGSVQAVDDIVDDTNYGREIDQSDPDETYKVAADDSTVLEGGETTMELLGNAGRPKAVEQEQKAANDGHPAPQATSSEESTNKKRRRHKRKRVAYDESDIPEARLRWVKTVEVAISLKG